MKFWKKLKKQARRRCTEEKIFQELTCPVCIQIYTDPVIFPCLHSLCRKCADAVKRTSRRFLCPECRSPVCQKLKRNFPLRNMVDLFHQNPNLEKVKSMIQKVSSPETSLGNDPEQIQTVLVVRPLRNDPEHIQSVPVVRPLINDPEHIQTVVRPQSHGSERIQTVDPDIQPSTVVRQQSITKRWWQELLQIFRFFEVLFFCGLGFSVLCLVMLFLAVLAVIGVGLYCVFLVIVLCYEAVKIVLIGVRRKLCWSREQMKHVCTWLFARTYFGRICITIGNGLPFHGRGLRT